MRHLLIVVCCLFLFALPALAQGTLAPLAPTPTDSAAAGDAARAEAAALQAQAHMEDAERYAGDASRFLGLFEAFSVVVAIAAAALGVVGVTRLFSAQAELRSARERVDSELADARQRFSEETDAQKRDLQALREQVLQSAKQQHLVTQQATLALAMLPFGERQYRAQDLKGAADTYQRALSLDEGNPLIHYRLGYVDVQSGGLEEAELHLKRALAIDPEFVLSMAALGYVYRRMAERLDEGMERDQMFNRGESYLLEALKRAPKLVDEDGESWWGSLGGLYRRREQIDQAVYAYTQAGKVTPYSSYPFSNLALLYMAKHDRDKMMAMYQRVERLARAEAAAEVDNYWAYADLLTARLALGKQPEAERALAAALDIMPPDSPYALETLADTLTRLLEALGGVQAAPHIPPYIERVRARLRSS